MVEKEHALLLKQGSEGWNKWRSANSFVKPDLSGADLRDSWLGDADLRGVNLTRADLSGAYLGGALVDRETRLPIKWRLVWDLVTNGGTGRDLSGVDLEGANLFLADLTGANLSNAHLRGANLDSAKLSRVVLVNADLLEADLSYVELMDADLRGADLRGSNCSNAKLTNTKLSTANLKDANLSNANLLAAELDQCNLTGAKLHNAQLDESTKISTKWRLVRDISTDGARSRDLSSFDLSGANLSYADLREAKLTGADLSHADLTLADLSDADLSGAVLREAILTGTFLKGVTTDAATVLDEKWQTVIDILTCGAEPMELMGINLEGANLSGAQMSGAILSGANLRNAMLRGVDLRNADLRKADLTGACLSSATAWGSHDGFWIFHRIPGPDSDVADLSNANLAEAVLRSADLTGTKLRGANLQGAIFGDELLDIPPHWQWMKFAYKNLNRMHGVTLLQSADLREADLSHSKLICTMLEGADLTDAKLNHADMRRSYLAASLLHRTVLDFADLREVSFSTAYGHGANVTGASFRGARVTGETEGRPHGGYLELASCVGLETATFDSDEFLREYLSRAWDYLHAGKVEEAASYPKFVDAAAWRISSLRRLFSDENLAPELIKDITAINAEMIAYLKKHKDAVHMVPPRVFEELIAELLAGFGWEVALTASTRDGGYDIFAISKDISGVKTSWIIECKKFAPEKPVGVGIARALYATKMRLGVAGAMLATTSYFTKDVEKYAASTYDLALRDYCGILEWINEYRPNPNGRLYINNSTLIVPGKDY